MRVRDRRRALVVSALPSRAPSARWLPATACSAHAPQIDRDHEHLGPRAVLVGVQQRLYMYGGSSGRRGSAIATHCPSPGADQLLSIGPTSFGRERRQRAGPRVARRGRRRCAGFGRDLPVGLRLFVLAPAAIDAIFDARRRSLRAWRRCRCRSPRAGVGDQRARAIRRVCTAIQRRAQRPGAATAAPRATQPALSSLERLGASVGDSPGAPDRTGPARSARSSRRAGHERRARLASRPARRARQLGMPPMRRRARGLLRLRARSPLVALFAAAGASRAADAQPARGAATLGARSPRLRPPA